VSTSDCDRDRQPNGANTERTTKQRTTEIDRLAPKHAYFYFRASLIRSLSKLLGHKFIDLAVIKNPKFAVEILILYVTIPEI